MVLSKPRKFPDYDKLLFEMLRESEDLKGFLTLLNVWLAKSDQSKYGNPATVVGDLFGLKKTLTPLVEESEVATRELEASLFQAMLNLLTHMGHQNPKKTNPPTNFSECLPILRVAIANRVKAIQEGRKHLSAIAPGLKEFRDAILEMGSRVTRLPDEELLDRVHDHLGRVQEQQTTLTRQKQMVNNRYCYFAAITKGGLYENASGHITFAFKEAEKKDFLRRLGQTITVEHGVSIVEWTHENGDKYAYVPVRVSFEDGTTMLKHESIHLKGGGTDYSLNGKHHQENASPCEVFKGSSYKTIIVPYFNNKPYLSFDIDNTMFSNILTDFPGDEPDFNRLHQPQLLTLEKVTQWFKELNEVLSTRVDIECRATTSRREKLPGEKDETLDALRKVCSNIKELSMAPKTFPGTSEERAIAKAICKTSRLPEWYWYHFDDEQIVLKTLGCGVHIVNCQDSKPVLHEPVTNPHHRTLMIFGAPGAGKSTLLRKLLDNYPNYWVPGVTEDNGGIVVTIISADGVEPDHKTWNLEGFARQVQARFPGRQSLTIVDTTGTDRALDGALQLGTFDSAANIVGMLSSILGRSGHANLNGRLVDNPNDVVPEVFDPAEPNQWSLTQLLNHWWFVTGGNQVSIKEKFARIGHQCNFTEIAGVTTVKICYSEGFQRFTSAACRQARNAILQLSPEGNWFWSKSVMEAGVEVFPDTKQMEGLGDHYIGRMSAFQKAVMMSLFTGQPMSHRGRKAVLTSKVDGSLVQISHISRYVNDSIRSMCASGNAFARSLAEASFVYSDGFSFMEIATNGTQRVSTHMMDYVLTAFAGDFELDIQVLMKKDYTGKEVDFIEEFLVENPALRQVLYVWHWDVVPLVVERQSRLAFKVEHLYRDANWTVQFEARNAHRTTCLGVVHTELAHSYEKSDLSVLGIKCEDGYWPHFELESEIHHSGFKQPMYWEITTGKDAINLLNLLQQVSTFEMTESQFRVRCHPWNKYPTDLPLDHEGFVFLMPTHGSKRWDYSKLKTVLYYIMHKPRESDIDLLTELSQMGDIPWFPVLSLLKEHREMMTHITREELTAGVLSLCKQYVMPEVVSLEGVPAKERKAIEKSNKCFQAWERMLAASDTNPSAYVKFMLGNNSSLTAPDKGSLSDELYSYIVRSFNLGYVVEKKTELSGVNMRQAGVALRRITKMFEKSVNTITKFATSYCAEDDMTTLCNHMLYLRLNVAVPKPV